MSSNEHTQTPGQNDIPGPDEGYPNERMAFRNRDVETMTPAELRAAVYELQERVNQLERRNAALDRCRRVLRKM